MRRRYEKVKTKLWNSRRSCGTLGRHIGGSRDHEDLHRWRGPRSQRGS